MTFHTLTVLLYSVCEFDNEEGKSRNISEFSYSLMKEGKWGKKSVGNSGNKEDKFRIDILWFLLL